MQDMNTPLHHAACGGHEAVAQLLLGGGATVDACCATGTAALREAAAHGHSGVLRLLLESGANAELRGIEPKARPFFALLCSGSKMIISRF
jgi:ankyrin repeat protein